jgi:hypothetical protein
MRRRKGLDEGRIGRRKEGRKDGWKEDGMTYTFHGTKQSMTTYPYMYPDIPAAGQRRECGAEEIAEGLRRVASVKGDRQRSAAVQTPYLYLRYRMIGMVGDENGRG